MTTITFDTRKAVRNLQSAGFSDAQADAMVDTLSAAFTETVATKTDIAEVKTDIAEVKTDLKADIAAVRADMDKLEASIRGDIKLLKWMIGVILACVAFPILKSFLA